MKVDRKINDIIIESANNIRRNICLLDETGEVVVSNVDDTIGTIDENFEGIEFSGNSSHVELDNKMYGMINFDGHRPLGIRIDGTDKEAEGYIFFLKK